MFLKLNGDIGIITVPLHRFKELIFAVVIVKIEILCNYLR